MYTIFTVPFCCCLLLDVQIDLQGLLKYLILSQYIWDTVRILKIGTPKIKTIIALSMGQISFTT